MGIKNLSKGERFLINPHILSSRLEARDDGEGLTPGEKKGGLGG